MKNLPIASLLGVFFVVGCGGAEFEAKPGQARALEIVWTEFFHADVSPPQLTWREDACPYGQQGVNVVLYTDGKCYYGLYLPDADVAEIAWPKSGTFADAAFAHELLHAWQADRGIFDYDHLLPQWNSIATINQQFVAEGL